MTPGASASVRRDTEDRANKSPQRVAAPAPPQTARRAVTFVAAVRKRAIASAALRRRGDYSHRRPSIKNQSGNQKGAHVCRKVGDAKVPADRAVVAASELGSRLQERSCSGRPRLRFCSSRCTASSPLAFGKTSPARGDRLYLKD